MQRTGPGLGASVASLAAPHGLVRAPRRPLLGQRVRRDLLLDQALQEGRDTQVLSGLESGTRVFIDLPPWAKKRR